ncbi:MAG: OmpA family protein [Planctomycetota bacterium]
MQRNIRTRRTAGLERRMLGSVAGLACFAALLGGCASQAEYDRLRETNRSLTERNEDLLARLDDAEALNNQLMQGGDSTQTALRDLRDQNASLRGLVDDYESEIMRLEAQLTGIDLGPLDPATDRALRDLAAANPNLVQYDPTRNMLRFSSDLTFDSGSDVVKPAAKSSLSQLAGVLRGVGASYEITVVGHTDNVQPGPTTRQRHPSNMHLSAHRAIAVRRELIGLGVSADKIQAAGWGEHRPAVPNNAGRGTAQNRRVEIFLLPSTANFGAAPASGFGSSGGSIDVDRSVPTRQPDPTK